MMFRVLGWRQFLWLRDGRIVWFGPGVAHGGFVVPTLARVRTMRWLGIASFFAYIPISGLVSATFAHTLARQLLGFLIVAPLWGALVGLSMLWWRRGLAPAHVAITTEELKAARHFTWRDWLHDALVFGLVVVPLSITVVTLTQGPDPELPALQAITAGLFAGLAAILAWDWWRGAWREMAQGSQIPRQPAMPLSAATEG